MTFDLDANGILSVSAVDKSTGARASVVISNTAKNSDTDVKRMVAEAKKYAAEDALIQLKVAARRQLEAPRATPECGWRI